MKVLELLLEEHAPSLLRFLFLEQASKEIDIRARLEDLKLQVVDDGEFRQSREHEEIVRELTRELNRVVPNRRPANYLDAMTIASVDFENRNGGKARYVFVSRSPKLFTLMDRRDELSAATVDALRWLRHPRTFTPFFGDPLGEPEQMSSLLRRNQKRLELFVWSVDRQLHGRHTQEIAAREVRSALTDARIHWRQSQRASTVAALAARLASRSQGAVHPNAQGLMPILFAAGESLERAVVIRLADSLSRLLNDHAAYGWYLWTSGDQARRELLRRLKLEERDTKAVVVDRSAILQCTVQLVSPGPRRLLERVLSTPSPTLDEVMTLLRGIDREVPLDETLLAMALPLALLGQWEVARMFARGAVSEGRRQESSVLHESLFFLAVCLRHTRAKPGDLDEALQVLQESERRKRDLKGDEKYSDPRFLKERATLLQAKRADARRAEKVGSSSPSVGAATTVERLLRRARALAKDDAVLRLLATNGLVYLLLTENWPEHRRKVEKEFARLESQLRQMFPAEENWPSNVLDTVGWAIFKLANRRPVERERRRCERLLELAIAKEQFGNRDTQRVRAHLDEVKASAIEAR